MKGARRLFGRSGYRLTVRYGRIYTICATEQRQPNSAAQRMARTIFAEANRLAVNELQNAERREHWEEEAHRRGYKTAIGACRAYYVGRLREAQEKAKSARKERSRPTIRAAETREARGERMQAGMTVRRRMHGRTRGWAAQTHRSTSQKRSSTLPP